MKELWLKNKLIIIILAFAVVFCAVAYFLAFPLVKRVKSVSTQIQEKTVDQKIEEARLGSLPQMEKDWQNFQEKKNSTDVILSPGSEISFIESIDSIAQNSGNVIDLKIGDQVDPAEIAKIKASIKKGKDQKGIMDEISYANYFPMQINLRGDYQNLVSFVHMLENNHFYVNIISIDSKKQMIDNNLAGNASMFSPDNEKAKDNIKETIITAINAIVYTQK
ncbi:MAG TPA: hypothetical protein P5232_03410 [Candidatus Moranbacteria bacterium]|nr:hypothetical protein [Candidatus Moranbacteria bacterium]